MSAMMAPASDEALLRALHDQHAHALWSYAVSLTRGDHARAQDVVQETLIRAWRTPAVLDQSRGSARGWLFTVAKRIAIDEWRSARSRHEFVAEEVPEAASDGFDAVAQHTVDRHIVVAALKTLSPEHRDVILECYFRGSSVAEASDALGVPPGTVKSRTHYALRALRTAMEEMGGTP